jgi:hypothetical protein
MNEEGIIEAKKIHTPREEALLFVRLEPTAKSERVSGATKNRHRCASLPNWTKTEPCKGHDGTEQDKCPSTKHRLHQMRDVPKLAPSKRLFAVESRARTAPGTNTLTKNPVVPTS